MMTLRWGWVVAPLVFFSSVVSAAPGDPGTACSAPTDCTGGFCVDKVCCSTACTGQCEACNVAGKEGTCTAVVGAPVGTRTACADGAGDVCAALSCDGVARDKCARYGTIDRLCRGAACSGGIATTGANCDGKGACPAATTVKCGAYACDGVACGTSCTTAAACAAGFQCSGGKCVLGPTCSSDGLSSVSAGGTKSCGPYRCRSDGLCSNSCVTDADCSDGVLKCDASGACRDPSAGIPPAGPRGDCAFGTGAGGYGAVAALALATLARLVRRR